MNKLSKLFALIISVLASHSMVWAGGWNCPPGAIGGGSVGRVSLLLLSLAVGYGVLVLSQSQQKPLNTLGRIIGGIILVVSFIGLLCSAMCGMKRGCSKSTIGCPMASHGAETGLGGPATANP